MNRSRTIKFLAILLLFGSAQGLVFGLAIGQALARRDTPEHFLDDIRHGGILGIIGGAFLGATLGRIRLGGRPGLRELLLWTGGFALYFALVKMVWMRG